MRLIGRLIILALLVAVVWSLFFQDRSPDVNPGSVVVLDVGGDYVEGPAPSALARLLGEGRTPLLSLYSELRKAERDPRVHAVVLRIGPTGMAWAKAQEVRDALGRLKQAGKQTVAYVELEPIGGAVEYYIASAAEKIWMAPGARIPFVGLAAEYLFLGGMFDKIGVDLEVERVGPYKTAADFLAGRSMSDANRDMANWLLDSVDEQFVNGIAEGRGLDPAAVRAAREYAPSAPDQLISAGLVDAVGFMDDVLDELGPERDVLYREDWALVKVGGFEPRARVALIYGSGNVVSGEGERTRRGDPVLAGTTVARNIREAAEDPEVDAILFRIDSPGGSALASDMVWHATQEARKEKPVVVSFSDVAASGGYYVACGADAILAQPGTVTGSIGVLMVRPVIARLYEKLGIGHEVITRGDGSRLFTSTVPLSPEERKQLGEEVERTYQLFLDRVEAGRELPREAIDKVARGRVWTGAQAKEHGLVDELGGIYASVAWIRRRLELPEDADVAMLVYPPPQTLAVQLSEAFRQGVHAVAPRLPIPKAAERALVWLESVATGAPVLVPEFMVEIR